MCDSQSCASALPAAVSQPPALSSAPGSLPLCLEQPVQTVQPCHGPLLNVCFRTRTCWLRLLRRVQRGPSTCQHASEVITLQQMKSSWAAARMPDFCQPLVANMAPTERGVATVQKMLEVLPSGKALMHEGITLCCLSNCICALCCRQTAYRVT